MNILHVNTYDTSGGAARAAYRIHKGLQEIGISSKMLVQTKLSDDRHVIGPDSKISRAWNLIRPNFDILPLQLYRRRKKAIYHIQWIPGSPLNNISIVNPDIIHLHWICDGFVRIEALKKIKKPIVWTLHDMWAFTGGCHYSDDCERYKSSCGKCPQLCSNREKDFSRWVWHRKNKAWQNLNLTIVTPSKWLAECVKESSLFQHKRIEVIPNGLDLKRYKPMDRLLAREILGLPKNKRLVLFGAMEATSDSRKGFQQLMPVIQKLKKKSFVKGIEVIVFGASEPENAPNFGLPTHYLGWLYDEVSIALLYSAVDVFIAPSVQDNLPNTVMEALACGTPVVAFNIGGMPDMIEHKNNGYLANPFEIEDLSTGIKWVLEDNNRYLNLCRNARTKVEREFGLANIAKKYLQLYRQIIAQ